MLASGFRVIESEQTGAGSNAAVGKAAGQGA